MVRQKGPSWGCYGNLETHTSHNLPTGKENGYIEHGTADEEKPLYYIPRYERAEETKGGESTRARRERRVAKERHKTLINFTEPKVFHSLVTPLRFPIRIFQVYGWCDTIPTVRH